jgi:ribosomal 50S subunit-recycling heat shock protein
MSGEAILPDILNMNSELLQCKRNDMRLDKYLKVSRLIKRRTVANEACDNGRVTLNGKTARASAEVKPGDVITISFGDKEVRAEVLAVQETVRKDAAQDLFRYL